MTGGGHGESGTQIVRAVGQHVRQGQLGTGEHHGQVDVRQHKGHRRRGIGHGVGAVGNDDAIEAGTRLLDMGVKAVLMKGGHVEGKPVFVTDWLLEKGREPVALRQPHVDTQNSHGTGCTLSAAIATQLGFGLPLRIAVTKAQEFLNLALRHSYAPGKGFGPVNHMAGLKK